MRWTRKETEYLVWLCRTNELGDTWEDISRRMRKKGYKRTASACNHKIFDLEYTGTTIEYWK